MGYRELNASAVKDKFPIPMVDELLNELHGAQHFTKLDLRSSNYQIEMATSCLEKIAFRTGNGTLISSHTFQGSGSPSLMNDIFKPYLHKFVLVSFDNILTFGKTWIETYAPCEDGF